MYMSSVRALCSGLARDEMQGGDGNDRLWYEDSQVSGGGCGNNFDLTVASSAGNSNADECGDTVDWGNPAWAGCEGGLTAKPTTCPP